MTAAIQPQFFTEAEAREITERIKRLADRLWTLLLEAHEGEAWRALGYASWSAYVSGEFDMSRQQSYRLLDQGRVIRAIAEVSPNGDTPHVTEREARDIKPHLVAVTNEVRERIEQGGATGEVVAEVVAEYRRPATLEPAPTPPNDAGQRRRRPLPDVARDVGHDLRKAVQRVERLGEDDRFTANKEQVAARLGHDLPRAIEVCQDLLDRLSQGDDS